MVVYGHSDVPRPFRRFQNPRYRRGDHDLLYAPYYDTEEEYIDFDQDYHHKGKGIMQSASREQARRSPSRKEGRNYTPPFPLRLAVSSYKRDEVAEDLAKISEYVKRYKEIVEALEVLGDVIDMYDRFKKLKGGKWRYQVKYSAIFLPNRAPQIL